MRISSVRTRTMRTVYVVKPTDFRNFNKVMNDLGFYWLNCNINPVLS